MEISWGGRQHSGQKKRKGLQVGINLATLAAGSVSGIASSGKGKTASVGV